MVYFVTDRSNEWLICAVPYDNTLREWTEGSRYRVSGEIYHFESAGKLFLHRCSVKRINEGAAP
jgi:hypothetical protein